MELEHYVDGLREQLLAAADAGGEDARALARRLIAPLDAAIRLTLLEVLSAAAAEITRELAPGSVEVRLRGGGPELVVSVPPAERGAGEAFTGISAAGLGEGAVSRFNLRLPDQLKGRVEQAADREGLSANAWLVRAVAAAVERGDAAMRPEQRTARGGEHYSGWAR